MGTDTAGDLIDRYACMLVAPFVVLCRIRYERLMIIDGGVGSYAALCYDILCNMPRCATYLCPLFRHSDNVCVRHALEYACYLGRHHMSLRDISVWEMLYHCGNAGSFDMYRDITTALKLFQICAAKMYGNVVSCNKLACLGF